MCPLSDESAKSSVVFDREADQEKSLEPSGPRIRCPLCSWPPARTTAGLVLAATHGTRSTPEECAPPASTSGFQRSVFPVPAGRHTPTGIQTNENSKQRSEEHTSELQSHSDLVCRLLLEKKIIIK